MVIKIIIKYWKLILIAILAGAVVGLYYSLDEAKSKSKRMTINYENAKSKTVQLINANKELYFKTNQLLLTVSEVEYSKDSAISEMVNQLEAADIKIKNINSLNNILIKSQGQSTEIIRVDTVFKEVQRYAIINDGFLFQRIDIESDSIKQKYTYNDSFILSDIREKRQLNRKGKKRNFIIKWIYPDWQSKYFAKSENPNCNMKIKSINIIKQ